MGIFYGAALFTGSAYLAKVFYDEAFTYGNNKSSKKKKAIMAKKALAEVSRPMTDNEIWAQFIAVKKRYKESVGTADEKILEEAMIRAERALQNPVKGFYMGAAAELSLESGKAIPFPLYLDWNNLDNHYMFFGTTRYGKTRALANHMRQFIEKGYNVILVDPKGGINHEIIAWAAQFAEDSGRLDDLAFYNPVFPTLTDYFNPLFGKGNSAIASEMMLLASGKSGAANGEDFFIQQIGKIIGTICTACEYLEKVQDPEGKKVQAEIEIEIKKYYLSKITNGHKVTFNKDTMIMNPDLSARINNKIVEPPMRTTEGAYKRKLLTYKDLAHYAMYDNLASLKSTVISTPIPPMDNIESASELRTLRDEALSLLDGSIGTSKEYYEKTTGSLIELLTRLSTGSIGRMFCTTPINPIALRFADKEKGMIAIIQPNPLLYQKVSDTIMKIFLKNLESIYADVAAGGRAKPRKTVLLIDEASKAMFPGVEEMFNKLGGLGMTLGLYTQSQADMIMMVGKDVARVIMDNINTVAYMKTNDNISKQDACQDYGQKRVVDYQMMVQGGVGGGGRSGVTSDLADIAHADSFDELEKGEALIKHYGKRYFVKIPFQPAPSGYLIMPELDSERVTREMLGFQSLLEKEMMPMELHGDLDVTS